MYCDTEKKLGICSIMWYIDVLPRTVESRWIGIFDFDILRWALRSWLRKAEDRVKEEDIIMWSPATQAKLMRVMICNNG